MQKVVLVALISAMIFVTASAVDAVGDSCSSTSTATNKIATGCKTGLIFQADDGTTFRCNCTAAVDGHYLNAEASETLPDTTGRSTTIGDCADGCATCVGGDNDECLTCASGFTANNSATLNSTIGGLCCDESCAVCDSTTVTNCKSCASGFGTLADNNLTATPAACEECTAASNCMTCETDSDATKKVCTACEDATFNASGVCTACPSLCNSCPNATFCTTCNGTGVTWNNSTQKCFASALKIGSVVATLVATGVLALVF